MEDHQAEENHGVNTWECAWQQHDIAVWCSVYFILLTPRVNSQPKTWIGIPSRLPSLSNEVTVQGPRPAVKPWQDTYKNPIKNCPIWMMRWTNSCASPVNGSRTAKHSSNKLRFVDKNRVRNLKSPRNICCTTFCDVLWWLQSLLNLLLECKNTLWIKPDRNGMSHMLNRAWIYYIVTLCNSVSVCL